MIGEAFKNLSLDQVSSYLEDGVIDQFYTSISSKVKNYINQILVEIREVGIGAVVVASVEV